MLFPRLFTTTPYLPVDFDASFLFPFPFLNGFTDSPRRNSLRLSVSLSQGRLVLRYPLDPGVLNKSLVELKNRRESSLVLRLRNQDAGKPKVHRQRWFLVDAGTQRDTR
ncbi:hypothetical protein HYQ44_015959 [Verticillium longisporum]|nr:hypothetical protein HYQ44_015959 [Verticillium longisporum]